MALAGPLSSQSFLPASLFPGKFPQSRPPSKMEDQAGTPAETKALCLASQESHRQMFRQSIVPLGETPLGTLSRLSDAAHRWLRPQERTTEQIVDMIVLEQFLSLLPEEMQDCLRARGPGSSSSSKEIARVVEAALQQQEPAEVIAKLPVNFEEPSVSLSESEQASVNSRQNTLYWEVMKEIDESGSSSMVLQLSDSNTSQTKAASFKKSETGILASIQPESIHPVSTCTVANPDIITVEIKSESQFWQDDPKDEGNEIPSWHIKEEEHNVSWYWPQQSNQQGSRPWEEEENAFHFGSNLEENHNPQIPLQTEQEVVDYTSAWPGKTYTSTSGYVAPEKRHPRGKSSYMWPECEKCPPISYDFVGHSEIFTELNSSENTLSNSSVLFKHVASTTRERCNAYKDCGESFACKSTLDRHWMSHTANRPHKCHECGKSFQTRSALVRHQMIHTGEKPHQCPHCGKSFRVKSSLTQHQRLHTGEKPFQCPDCGKRFNERMKLVNHYKTHTGERPYQCFDCDKGFITRSSLVRHERVHS